MDALAETRDRTGDLQIFGLTLSQLSYRGLNEAHEGLVTSQARHGASHGVGRNATAKPAAGPSIVLRDAHQH